MAKVTGQEPTKGENVVSSDQEKVLQPHEDVQEALIGELVTPPKVDENLVFDTSIPISTHILKTATLPGHDIEHERYFSFKQPGLSIGIIFSVGDLPKVKRLSINYNAKTYKDGEFTLNKFFLQALGKYNLTISEKDLEREKAQNTIYLVLDEHVLTVTLQPESLGDEMLELILGKDSGQLFLHRIIPNRSLRSFWASTCFKRQLYSRKLHTNSGAWFTSKDLEDTTWQQHVTSGLNPENS